MEVITGVRSWSRVPIIVLSARSGGRQGRGARGGCRRLHHQAVRRARARGARAGGAAAQRRGRRQWRAADHRRLAHRPEGAPARAADGRELHLTPIEYRLLEVLSRHLGLVVTHPCCSSAGLGPRQYDHAQSAGLHEASARQARARSSAAALAAHRDRSRLSAARRRGGGGERHRLTSFSSATPPASPSGCAS